MPEKRDNNIIVKTYLDFFVNKGNEAIEEFKWFSWTEFVKVKIFVYDDELAKYIKSYFAGFIFDNNFGTRKSKGFGSFTVVNDNGDIIQSKNASKYFFEIDYPNISEGSLNQLIKHYEQHDYRKIGKEEALFLLENKYIFDYIDLIYRAMRSGINVPGRDSVQCTNDSRFYLKSLLFYYFKEKHKVQWDKKSIKEHFYFGSSPFDCLPKQKSVNSDPDSPINFTDSLPQNNKLLIRDLLGLSTEQSWLSYKNDTITKASVDKIKSEPIYARFMSPINFKPIRLSDGFRVYIGATEFPEELLGKSFAINSKNNPSLNPFFLTFPNSFNIQEYLNFVFEEKNSKGNYFVDLDTFIDPDYQDENIDEFFILSEIFSSIRYNLNQQ